MISSYLQEGRKKFCCLIDFGLWHCGMLGRSFVYVGLVHILCYFFPHVVSHVVSPSIPFHVYLYFQCCPYYFPACYSALELIVFWLIEVAFVLFPPCLHVNGVVMFINLACFICPLDV